MKKNYEWKMPSFGKGVDAGLVVRELKKINTQNGNLSPATIVQSAKWKSSPLHCLFEWDDSKAAEQFRLQQARNLVNNIQVTVISNGEPTAIPVYEVVTVNGDRSYKHIETMTPENIEEVRARTVNELRLIKTKLDIYKQFDSVILKLDEAIELIK